MILFKSLRIKTGNYVLGKKIRNLSRKKQFINYDDIKTVGVLFSQTGEESFGQVNEFLKELSGRGKQTFAIGYVDAPEIPDALLLRRGYNFFCNKDTNWYFRPEIQFVNDFLEREFDLLINLSLSRKFPLDYIFSLSRAKFKAGKFFGDWDQCDLSIDIKDRPDIGYLSGQITHYLEMINKKSVNI